MCQNPAQAVLAAALSRKLNIHLRCKIKTHTPAGSIRPPREQPPASATQTRTGPAVSAGLPAEQRLSPSLVSLQPCLLCSAPKPALPATLLQARGARLCPGNPHRSRGSPCPVSRAGVCTAHHPVGGRQGISETERTLLSTYIATSSYIYGIC